MILYCDIDNTLTNPVESTWSPDNKNHSHMSLHGKDWIMPPDPERLRLVKAAYAEGHRIVIWTCRTNPLVMGLDHEPGAQELLVEKVRQWLVYHNVPYHEIERTPKPFFTYLWDDRAVNPEHPVDMLRLRYSRLKRFVCHDDNCGAQEMQEPWSEDELCSCGLSAMLNEDWGMGLKGSVRGGSQEP